MGLAALPALLRWLPTKLPRGATSMDKKSYQHQYYLKNKEKIISQAKKWAKDNPEKRTKIARNSHITIKYGINIEQEQDIKLKQNNKCPICKAELGAGYKTHIDHSHTTGEIRGILCHACNVLLGHARESAEILQSAVKYLKKYN